MILVLGGARSGKSTFAEQLAHDYQQQYSGQVAYIATAQAFDKDMKDRIKKHQMSRPSNWVTIEQSKHYETLLTQDAFVQSPIILLDCMTLLVTNLLLESPHDFDHISPAQIDDLEASIQHEVFHLVNACNDTNKQLIIVSNEVGLGIVPAYRLGAIFRDIAGRLNQLLAKEADAVYLLTAGIPQRLKG